MSCSPPQAGGLLVVGPLLGGLPGDEREAAGVVRRRAQGRRGPGSDRDPGAGVAARQLLGRPVRYLLPFNIAVQEALSEAVWRLLSAGSHQKSFFPPEVV